MTENKNKTLMIKKGAHKPSWFILDATGKTLGRFASEIAKILRGKHKPDFTPHADTGDGVIVINADKIRVTGNKATTKIYKSYTGYIGGLREIPYNVMQAKKPEYIIEHAVRGMVPRTKLGKSQSKRLKVFTGDRHGMEAQKPIQVTC